MKNNTTSTLQQLKEIIVKAVPEVKGVCSTHSYHHGDCFACACGSRPIQLADVLRAIEKLPEEDYFKCYLAGGNGELTMRYDLPGTRIDTSWNLAKNLDDQEPAVHEFLLSVIS